MTECYRVLPSFSRGHQVSGDGPLVVQWTKEGRLLEATPTPTPVAPSPSGGGGGSDGSRGLRLEVARATPADAGVYVCRTANAWAADSAAVHLAVQGCHFTNSIVSELIAVPCISTIVFLFRNCVWNGRGSRIAGGAARRPGDERRGALGRTSVARRRPRRRSAFRVPRRGRPQPRFPVTDPFNPLRAQ